MQNALVDVTANHRFAMEKSKATIAFLRKENEDLVRKNQELSLLTQTSCQDPIADMIPALLNHVKRLEDRILHLTSEPVLATENEKEAAMMRAADLLCTKDQQIERLQEELAKQQKITRKLELDYQNEQRMDLAYQRLCKLLWHHVSQQSKADILAFYNTNGSSSYTDRALVQKVYEIVSASVTIDLNVHDNFLDNFVHIIVDLNTQISSLHQQLVLARKVENPTVLALRAEVQRVQAELAGLKEEHDKSARVMTSTFQETVLRLESEKREAQESADRFSKLYTALHNGSDFQELCVFDNYMSAARAQNQRLSDQVADMRSEMFNIKQTITDADKLLCHSRLSNHQSEML